MILPFSEFLGILRPIFTLYDNCDYESAAILARKELGQAKERSLQILLQVLVHFFEGHSRWESSYDYAMARGLLKKAEEAIDESLDFCSELEKDGLLCVGSLCGVLEAAINLENALISVDAQAMVKISKELSDTASDGLERIEKFEDTEGNLLGWLKSQLIAWQMYFIGVGAYSESMTALRTKEFDIIYQKSESTILECLERILEEEDEDSYTELTSYLEFLKHHREMICQYPDYLVLKGNRLTWLFSFWGKPETLNSIYDSLIQDSKQFEKEMALQGISVETIDEDSLSDLFETVLGEQRMNDLVLTLKPLTLNFRGQELEIRMSVRIYRYGVATIYLETDIDELTISDLRVCLSFNGPHSTEFDIQWENRLYTRLSTIAEEIVSSLRTVFAKLDTEISLRFVSHLNWYGYVLIKRGIWSRGNHDDKLLNLEEASKFPDYKGLLLGQMEARAALDDWIMKDPIGIRNLAPI